MKCKLIRLLLIIAVCLFNLPLSQVSAQFKPSFIIFTYGFWGSLDKLPSADPAWLEASPYPHIRKHQSADFLSGPDYQPIPQPLLATGEGPSVTKYFFCSYYLLEHELAYWAEKINKQEQSERIKLFHDWQVLQTGNAEETDNHRIGDINIIYLKYDWRLELPQVERDYVKPLLSFIDQRWPESEIHWVGHSLGGLVGRYAVASHPGRFRSLISIGGPHYGIYELGMQCRGERVTYNGQWDLEKSQEFGLRVAERFFFGTHNILSGRNFYASAAEFIRSYLPMMHWMDPKAGLLEDGFGSLTKLKEAVPHAISIYGLGFGSYDLQGDYHPAISDCYGMGPGLAPGKDSPKQYAITGDGRVDPVSAIGPFKNILCLGKDKPHGNMMWSPLVLTFLIDRYFYAGKMSPQDLWLAMRRFDVPFIKRKQEIEWVLKARRAWEGRD